MCILKLYYVSPSYLHGFICQTRLHLVVILVILYWRNVCLLMESIHWYAVYNWTSSGEYYTTLNYIVLSSLDWNSLIKQSFSIKTALIKQSSIVNRNSIMGKLRRIAKEIFFFCLKSILGKLSSVVDLNSWSSITFFSR